MRHAVKRNYGLLLLELCRTVPDGVVCFFVSYAYLDDMVAAWENMYISEKTILQEIMACKLLFVETGDMAETMLALDLYRKACDSGRGETLCRLLLMTDD